MGEGYSAGEGYRAGEACMDDKEAHINDIFLRHLPHFWDFPFLLL